MNKSQAVALFMSLSLATGVTACAGQPQQTGGGEEGGNPAMTSPQPQQTSGGEEGGNSAPTSPQPKKTSGGEEGASLAPTSPSAANWHQSAPRQSLDATLYLAGRGERGERSGRGERGERGGRGERGERGEGGERSALPSSQIV
ncbi:hypothetical protein OsccyDRAFT_2879 [Leptolyngbyaceae cyanobacterium JSC-12]|nr:hypothetical protein OsccyDRAFT_2879 [Leptolyngbyaceae cyanobacterium JSC-12]